MGIVVFGVMGFVSSLLFLGGWASLYNVCECVAPLSGQVANGTMGLFTITGICVGIVISIICS